VAEAEGRLARLADLGIDLGEVTADLQREGIEKFSQPFEKLLTTLESKRSALAAAS
jgi:transaldolase